MHDIVQGLRARGIEPPVVLRFSDLARHRLVHLRDAFDRAIKENEYEGGYRFIFPVKVNPARIVCEEMRDFGAPYGFGLEAGSKPELLAVLGMTVDHDDMPVVCNGFKDREYIKTVVLATKLGRNIIPVVERRREMELIVEQAEALRHAAEDRPAHQARGQGHGQVGLERGDAQQVRAHRPRGPRRARVPQAARHGRLPQAAALPHRQPALGHPQPQGRHRRAGVLLRRAAAARAPGSRSSTSAGGLGVDYDGSHSSYASSANYSVEEYASDVVYRIGTACDDAEVPHPMIFSESGRAVVAYASVLVFDVVGRLHYDVEPDSGGAREARRDEEDTPQPVLDLLEVHGALTDRTLVEAYHDAIQARDEMSNLFSLGYLSLPMRAAGERLFWSIGRRILARAQKLGDLPDEFADLSEGLSDIYYCNFSVFQSLPDSWAINQVFPIVPLHRLDERPTRAAILADITCDSDGKIDRFVDRRDFKRTLELHEPPTTSRTPLASASWAPTRRCSATCTTSSAIRTWCTSPSTTRGAGSSTRSSRATR